MLIFTRESFKIPEIAGIEPAPGVSGYISSSQTYEYCKPHTQISAPDGTLTDAATEEPPIIGTIKNFEMRRDQDSTPQPILTLYPVWTVAGPEDRTVEINLREYSSAKHVYVHCTSNTPNGVRPVRRKASESQKSWVFRFPRNEVVVSPSSFVKIIYHDEELVKEDGRRVTHGIYGYITDVYKSETTGAEMCTISQLCGYRGMFGFDKVSLQADLIRSIFYANVEVSDFTPRPREDAEEAADEVTDA